MKKPKDLGVKISTKEESYWTQVKKRVEAQLEDTEKSLKFHKAVLDMCNEKIDQEEKIDY